MRKIIYKSRVVLVAAFILSIIYLRSGTTYYSNVGFGGSQIAIRLGTVSYNYLTSFRSSAAECNQEPFCR